MSDNPTSALPVSLIIELFGGVRPLAKKLDMAASTVQGWKLRNHIPDNYHSRLRDLLDPQAQARFDQIVAGDILSGNSDIPLAEVTLTPPVTPPHHMEPPRKPDLKTAALKTPPRDPNAHYFAMPQAHMRYWIMSSLATMGAISFVVLVLILVFFGKDLFDMLEQQPAMPPVPAVAAPSPADLERLEESRAAIEKTLANVKKIKKETPASQTELVKSMDQIETMVGTLRDRIDSLDKQLQNKGIDTKAISEQIEQINRRDVAAAALLLGMAQLHSTLDRQATFSDDLKLLKALLGHDPQMVKSLDKLAPFAERGLMTREQLNETLEMVAMQTLTISQQQPHLEWWERLRLALNNVIQIRREEADMDVALGQPQADTPQGQIKAAQDAMQNNDFAAAAQALENYQGPQADMILEAAYNMQGRAAAMQLFNGLMEKGQQLLDVDNITQQLPNVY